MSKQFLLLGLLMLLFFSCELEKTIDYDTYFDENQIVVNAFLSSTGVEARVSKAVSPLTIDASPVIENAKVSLFEDNELVAELTQPETGYFVTPNDFTPKPDADYSLKVEADGLQSVTSQKQKLQNTVSLLSVYYEQSEEDEHKFHLHYSFADPENVQNFYTDRFYRFGNGANLDSEYYREFINPYAAYSDAGFDGEEYYISKNFYRSVSTSTGGYVHVDSIKVVLYSLSPDFYAYLSSVTDYETTKQDPWFEQPSVVYTNINNGYGIFGAYSTDTLTLVTDDLFDN